MGWAYFGDIGVVSMLTPLAVLCLGWVLLSLRISLSLPLGWGHGQYGWVTGRVQGC